MRRLAFVLALLICAAHASSAFAHASLVKAEPADGAVVPSAPGVLSLTFNEPVAPLVMHLIGPAGEPVAFARVVAENDTVTLTPSEPLGRGTHVLSWRVISADGHPVGSSVLFSIGAPSQAPGHQTPGHGEEGDRAVRGFLWAVKLALYIGLFVGAGGAFFLAWIDRPNSSARRGIVVALLAGLAAAPLSIALQGLDALALPLPAVLRPSAWAAGVGTSYGYTAIASALALLAGVLSLASRSRAWSRGLSLAGLLGVGLALALSGHASTAAPQLVNRPVVALHGICVAFWIGSLLPLYADVRGSAAVGDALERFSRAIPIPLALLVVTGAWLAVVQLGRVNALWTTDYGKVLACKLAAVALLLALAAANRYRLVPKLQREGAAGGRPLAMSLALELALAVAILGLVALWRFTPPPRALPVEAPISVHVHGERAMAQIEIARDGAAGERADIQVLDGAFQPLAVKEVTLVFGNPAAGIEPMRRIAVPAGDNRWRIDHLTIPVAGRWTLSVELLIDDFDKVTIEDTVALPRLP